MKTSKQKLDDFFSETRDHIQPPTREQLAGRMATVSSARSVKKILIGMVSAGFGALLFLYLLTPADPDQQMVENTMPGTEQAGVVDSIADKYSVEYFPFPEVSNPIDIELDSVLTYSDPAPGSAEPEYRGAVDGYDVELDADTPSVQRRLSARPAQKSARDMLNTVKANVKLRASELAALGLVEQECGLHFFRRVEVDLSDELVRRKWIENGLSPDEPFYINKTVAEYLSVGGDKVDKPYPPRELIEGPKPLLVMAAQAGRVYGPTMHFDSRGKQLNRIRMERDGYELEDGISLGSGLVVAVQVPMKCSTTEFTVVLWYELNKELIEHLPQRFRAELEYLFAGATVGVADATAEDGDDQYTAPEENADAIENARVFPNPASSEATLEFECRVSTYALIGLYNMQGGLEREIFSGNMNPGARDIRLDLSDVANGMYMIRFQGGSRAPTTLNLVVRH